MTVDDLKPRADALADQLEDVLDLLDPDEADGGVQRARATLREYRLFQLSHAGQSDLFSATGCQS